MPKRREMQEFKITELSGVDRPAQAHAKMTIMKRADPLDEEDLNKGARNMPDDNKELEGLQKQVAELTAKLEAATKAQSDAEFLAKMDGKEKAWFETLSDDEKEKARKCSPEERAAMMNKALASDEVVKIDGVEIRKSAVGDAQFTLLKQTSERMAAIEKSAAADREALAKATFEKRAEDEFGHLPGDKVAKGALLKAVNELPEEVRSTLDTMLKAGEKAIVSAFNSIGTRGDLAKKAAGDFSKRVDEIAARDKINKTAALQKARKEYPEEFKVYQDLENGAGAN